MKKIFIFVLLFSWINASLPQGIEEILNKYQIDRASISIDIKDLHSSLDVASLNINSYRTPASIIKLFTTYSALLHLGFNYRWATLFYYNGDVKSGVLYGDLIIKPYGDPNLSSKSISAIAYSIKAKGISEIRGDIIIDRSIFNVSSRDTSGFDSNRYSPYNAMPDSMMFNERVTTLNIDTLGNRVVVSKDTPDNSFDIINSAKVTNGSCRGNRAWVNVKIDKELARPKVFISGKLSNRCSTRKVCRVITKPYKTFYYSLKYALDKIGVQNHSKLKLSPTPSTAKILFTYKSKRLEETISIISKKSNNLMARQLMLTLGAYIYNRPSSISKGRKAIIKILSDNGIKLGSNTIIDNGCGLSRISQIKASDITKLLLSSFNKFGYRWLNTLSIAGVDGTTKKRFKNSIVANRGWFKTGTIKSVKNIIGYVKSNSGRLYSIVILVNHTKSYQGASLQNDIIKWIIKNY
ncbi:D-alanyl-D-alanine carboxypeptidase [hydrothermal vent metagenome]|uniref:D-alanyl-D-alanine carboxypeptidase n=1 Tax=hydrothermal vent metagenome TaxID=652676 RepID=A0A1W1EL87_9ZZZZ